MSPNDNFRRELNNAIDDVSGAPSPALRDRVRSAITEAQPERSTYWIAAVAACVITALIVGILYVNNPFRRPPVGANPTPTPMASPSTQPTPSPSPSPTPTQAYICTAVTMDHSLPVGSPIAYVNDFRVGAHPGYDRVVIEFSNGIPTEYVAINPRVGTSFQETSSGQAVTLKGKNGILVSIHGADGHTSYPGPRDYVKSFPALAEARVIEDQDGVVNIALGINGAACYHAEYQTNPARIVIDVQAAG